MASARTHAKNFFMVILLILMCRVPRPNCINRRIILPDFVFCKSNRQEIHFIFCSFFTQRIFHVFSFIFFGIIPAFMHNMRNAIHIFTTAKASAFGGHLAEIASKRHSPCKTSRFAGRIYYILWCLVTCCASAPRTAAHTSARILRRGPRP